MLSRRGLLPLAALLLLACSATVVSAGYCSLGVFARVGACGRFVDVDVSHHKQAGTRPYIVCPLTELNKPDHLHAWVVIGDRHTGDFSLNSQSFPYSNHGTQELGKLERGSVIRIRFENKHTDITACKGDPQRLPLYCEKCNLDFEVDVKFEGEMIAGATAPIVARVADHLPGVISTCEQPVHAKLWTCGGRTFRFNLHESGSEVTIRCPRRFLNTISPLTASISSEWIHNLVGRAGVFRINAAKFRRQNRGGVIVRLTEGMTIALRYRTQNKGEQADTKCNSAKLNVRVLFEDTPAPAPTTPSTGSGSEGQDTDSTDEDPIGVPTGSYGAPQMGDSTSPPPPSTPSTPTSTTTAANAGSAAAGSTGAKAGGAAAAAGSTGSASSGELTQNGGDNSRPTTQSPLPVTVIRRPSSSTGGVMLAEGANAASRPVALNFAAIVAVICAMMAV